MTDINLDFQIMTDYNPKYLVVVDTSDWGVLSKKPAIIEITTPGFNTPVTHYFDKNKVNVFHTFNLGLNCSPCGSDKAEYEDLPDGIYTFTLKASPSQFNTTRTYLKTDLIRLKLDEAFIKVTSGCNDIDSKYLETLQLVDFYIKSAEAHTRSGSFCEAQELLFKAEKTLKTLKGCKTCV